MSMCASKQAEDMDWSLTWVIQCTHVLRILVGESLILSQMETVIYLHMYVYTYVDSHSL